MALQWMETGRVEAGPDELFLLAKTAAALGMGGLVGALGEELCRLSRAGGEEALVAVWLGSRLSLPPWHKARLLGALADGLGAVEGCRQWAALPRGQVEALLAQRPLASASQLSALLYWLHGLRWRPEDKELFLSRSLRLSADLQAHTLEEMRALWRAQGLELSPAGAPSQAMSEGWLRGPGTSPQPSALPSQAQALPSQHQPPLAVALNSARSDDTSLQPTFSASSPTSPT